MRLVAWVRFVRDGQEVSMSKRAGEFITLDELLAEVGVDAARWSFGSRTPSTPIDFDIELAKKQSAENPVYYVQYAHARICSILRKATEAGIAPAASLAGHARRRRRRDDASRARCCAYRRSWRTPRRGRPDAGHHGLRDGARDHLPRVLPRPSRRARRRTSRSDPPSARARRRDADRPAQRARPAGHLRPREHVTVGAPAPAHRIARDAGRRASAADAQPRHERVEHALIAGHDHQRPVTARRP